MLQFLHDFWPHLVGVAIFVIETVATVHAVLYKRDSRATIGWVGLILLTPLFGAILYWIFGVNRIHRRAILMRAGQPESEPAALEHAAPPEKVAAMMGAGAALLAIGRPDAKRNQSAAFGREQYRAFDQWR